MRIQSEDSPCSAENYYVYEFYINIILQRLYITNFLAIVATVCLSVFIQQLTCRLRRVVALALALALALASAAGLTKLRLGSGIRLRLCFSAP